MLSELQRIGTICFIGTVLVCINLFFMFLFFVGNYNCLVSLGYLGFFGSPREYYLELGRHILLFYDTVDFFNEDLIALAIHVSDYYNFIFFYLILSRRVNSY